jgi:hypothetical protein
MFSVSEAEAAAIRTVFEQEGELCAAIELRRVFPFITDNKKAQEFARIIVGWKPLPTPTATRPAQPVPGVAESDGGQFAAPARQIVARPTSTGSGKV